MSSEICEYKGRHAGGSSVSGIPRLTVFVGVAVEANV